MPNTQIPLNSFLVDNIYGVDADGNVQQLSSLSVSADDKTVGYVASYPGEGVGGFIVVPNQSLIGTKTLTLTSVGADLSGNPLPNQTKQYDVVGAVPPPPATAMQFGATPRIGAFPGIPTDPGTSAKLI